MVCSIEKNKCLINLLMARNNARRNASVLLQINVHNNNIFHIKNTLELATYRGNLTSKWQLDCKSDLTLWIILNTNVLCTHLAIILAASQQSPLAPTQNTHVHFVQLAHAFAMTEALWSRFDRMGGAHTYNSYYALVLHSFQMICKGEVDNPLDL